MVDAKHLEILMDVVLMKGENMKLEELQIELQESSSKVTVPSNTS